MAGLADVRLEWSDIRVFEELTYLCKLRKKRGLVPYVIPSRQYLAKKTGFCITTVSRSTNRLVTQGLLRKVQRRPVRGIYHTCLYKPIQRKFWRLAAALGKLWKPEQQTGRAGCSSHRVTPLSPKHLREKKITLRRGNKGASHPPESTLSSSLAHRMPLLAVWRERGGS